LVGNAAPKRAAFFLRVAKDEMQWQRYEAAPTLFLYSRIAARFLAVARACHVNSVAILMRPGFAAMLERIEGNGVRTIIVETASRFARDLMVQEVGHAKLRERGIDLIAADNPGSFIDDTPTAKLVRQVLGAISEFDKAMTVAKLRGARERKRREVGKCEGRNPKASRRLPLAPSQKTTASRASILRRSE
jgi:DNA invertase Pin-like site-specific DNA recombinase